MSFKKTNIPYQETGLFSKVFTDYLEGAPGLKSFYEYIPSLKSFAEVIAKMGKYEYRSLLSHLLREYYNGILPD